jgi:ribonuclease P protein component
VVKPISTFSFSRHYRLNKPADYTRVFDNALRSRDRYYTLLFRASEGDSARVGFAVAKKRISAANDRNRVRRLARESFRQHRHNLPVVDIIILAQSSAVAATNKELFASLEKHWRRLAEMAGHAG